MPGLNNIYWEGEDLKFEFQLSDVFLPEKYYRIGITHWNFTYDPSPGDEIPEIGNSTHDGGSTYYLTLAIRTTNSGTSSGIVENAPENTKFPIVTILDANNSTLFMRNKCVCWAQDASERRYWCVDIFTLDDIPIYPSDSGDYLEGEIYNYIEVPNRSSHESPIEYTIESDICDFDFSYIVVYLIEGNYESSWYTLEDNYRELGIPDEQGFKYRIFYDGSFGYGDIHHYFDVPPGTYTLVTAPIKLINDEETYPIDAEGTQYIEKTRYIITISKPVQWEWSSDISQGNTLQITGHEIHPITADEWNLFTERINEFRNYIGSTSYSFTTVATSDNFMDAYNEAVDAIKTAGDGNSYGAYVSYINSSDLAVSNCVFSISLFDSIRAEANAIVGYVD